jgi:hypothetical protein
VARNKCSSRRRAKGTTPVESGFDFTAIIGQSHQKKIAGPLMDRINSQAEVLCMSFENFSSLQVGEPALKFGPVFQTKRYSFLLILVRQHKTGFKIEE